MQRYQNNVQDQFGNAIPNVTVTVTENPGGAVATIYSDNGVTTKSNPFTNESDGEFTFFAADGRYDITLSGGASDAVIDVVLQDSVAANGVTNDNGSIFLSEKATPETDQAGLGQIWVRDDSPTNVLVYRSGNGNEIVLASVGGDFAGLINAAYEYDSGVGGGDPGTGLVAFDSVTPASITEMYIDDESNGGLNREWVYNLMDVGDKLVVASESDANDYLLFEVTSVTDSTGFWTVGLNYIGGGTIFSDTDVVRVTWVPGPNSIGAVTLRETSGAPSPGAGNGSFFVRDDGPNQAGFASDIDQEFALQNRIGECDYVFSTTTTDADPGDGTLRYDNATPASITEIYIDNIDHFAGGMNDWALTDLKRGDIIEVVTLQNDARYQRFRVTGDITDGTGYQKIPVAPIDTGTLHNDGENVRVKIHKNPTILQGFGIQSESYTPTGTTQTLAYEDGPDFEVDLESVTGNPTITLGGTAPPSGIKGQITVKVRQDSATARTITWAGGTFEWLDNTAHVMNATLDGFSIFTFETWDNGTTWFAAGADYGA